jgi:hypothetical protein
MEETCVQNFLFSKFTKTFSFYMINECKTTFLLINIYNTALQYDISIFSHLLNSYI